MWYETILQNIVPFIGLLLGAILAWAVPYLRAGLEAVEEADSFAAWPKFKVGYISMTLYPLLLVGIGMLTDKAILDTILGLSFYAAVLYTYGASRAGHEVVKFAAVVYNLRR